MRAVVQRVKQAKVEVSSQAVGAIGPGLLVFLGVGDGDTSQDSSYLAKKIANLRIFPDQNGKLNLSVQEIGGSILAVSQFTLYGDCRRGRRPSFTLAADPKLADDLYEKFVADLREIGLVVETGVFQADMDVHLINDGPVTMLLSSGGEF